MRDKMSVESLDLARRIRAARVCIHIEEDDCRASQVPSEGLLINLYGGATESTAFGLCGGTGFILYLTITINLPRFAISAFGLEVPWANEIRWLEDPLEIDGSSNVYRFGGRNLPEFERDRVLNHFAEIRHIYSRGSSLKGCLLGIGTAPIPDRFPHGAMIPVFLTVFDQYWREYRSPVSLWADRSQELHPGTRSRVVRKRLFECPDPEFDHGRTQEADLRQGAYEGRSKPK